MSGYTAGRRGDPTCPAPPPPLPASLLPVSRLLPCVSPPPSHAYIHNPCSNRPAAEPGPRFIPPQPPSRIWTPNISPLIERGYRCCGQNGSVLQKVTHSRWFYNVLYELYLKVTAWTSNEACSRGPLDIGIRCDDGNIKSVAVLLLFGACCREFEHTVFLHAPHCNICGCSHWNCYYTTTREMYEAWHGQAEVAKKNAIAMWRSFQEEHSA